MTDKEICSHVMSARDDTSDEESEEVEAQPTCPVTNSQEAYMFEKCLTRLKHQPKANHYNACTLRELCTCRLKTRAVNEANKYNGVCLDYTSLGTCPFCSL